MSPISVVLVHIHPICLSSMILYPSLFFKPQSENRIAFHNTAPLSRLPEENKVRYASASVTHLQKKKVREAQTARFARTSSMPLVFFDHNQKWGSLWFHPWSVDFSVSSDFFWWEPICVCRNHFSSFHTCTNTRIPKIFIGTSKSVLSSSHIHAA